MDTDQLPTIDDVISEIYAMVKPKNLTDITLDDLINCKCGGTVITMLIDVHGFLAYDQRESHQSSPEEDSVIESN